MAIIVSAAGCGSATIPSLEPRREEYAHAIVHPPVIDANVVLALATLSSDIFKPTKFGGKYTVTLIPGMDMGPCIGASRPSRAQLVVIRS